MKHKLIIVYLIIGSLLMSGCATMKSSLYTGAGVGAVTGALAGGTAPFVEDHTSVVLTGMVLGGFIGLGIAAVLYEIRNSFRKKRDTKTEEQTLLNLNFDKFSVSNPSKSIEFQDFRLSAPDVNKECFELKMKKSKLFRQHCIWNIQGNSFLVPVSN